MEPAQAVLGRAWFVIADHSTVMRPPSPTKGMTPSVVRRQEACETGRPFPPARPCGGLLLAGAGSSRWLAIGKLGPLAVFIVVMSASLVVLVAGSWFLALA